MPLHVLPYHALQFKCPCPLIFCLSYPEMLRLSAMPLSAYAHTPQCSIWLCPPMPLPYHAPKWHALVPHVLSSPAVPALLICITMLMPLSAQQTLVLGRGVVPWNSFTQFISFHLVFFITQLTTKKNNTKD